MVAGTLMVTSTLMVTVTLVVRGAMTVSSLAGTGERTASVMLVTRDGGRAFEEPSQRHAHEYPETFHCLGSFIVLRSRTCAGAPVSGSSAALCRAMGQNPNLPTIELAEAALPSSGTPSSCSVVRNNE